jgi:hypothetical protein
MDSPNYQTIKKRYNQLIQLKQNLIKTGNEQVDLDSYLIMLDFNIDILADFIKLVDAVNSGDSETVSSWFDRFRVE